MLLLASISMQEVPCVVTGGNVKNLTPLYSDRCATHGKTGMFPRATVIPIDQSGLVCRRANGDTTAVVADDSSDVNKVLFVDASGNPQLQPWAPSTVPIPVSQGGTNNDLFGTAPGIVCVTNTNPMTIGTADPDGTADMLPVIAFTNMNTTTPVYMKLATASDDVVPHAVNFISMAGFEVGARDTVSNPPSALTALTNDAIVIAVVQGKRLSVAAWAPPVVTTIANTGTDADGLMTVSGTVILDGYSPESYMAAYRQMSNDTGPFVLTVSPFFVDDEASLTSGSTVGVPAPLSCHSIAFAQPFPAPAPPPTTPQTWVWTLQTTYPESPAVTSYLQSLNWANYLWFVIYATQTSPIPPPP